MLLVLLALNLPGWAFAAMPACSMQHAAAGVADDAHASMLDAGAAHAAHCCADNQSTDDSSAASLPAGTACQDGAHCQCGTLYQAMQPVVASAVPGAPDIAESPFFPVITASALPLWRPPTSA